MIISLNINVWSRIQTTIEIASKVYFSLLTHKIISKIITVVKKVINNAIKEYLVNLLIWIKALSAPSFTSSLPFLPKTDEKMIKHILLKVDKNKIKNNSNKGIMINRKYGRIEIINL